MPSQPCTRSRNTVAQPIYRSSPELTAPTPARIGRAAITPTTMVGLLAGPYPAATVRGLDRRREPSQARSMDDDQPLPELPDDWEAQDSLGCFYEYIELCRQERLAGKRDLPPLFQPYRPQE
jgi:hypothetical protein